jgi:DnaJ-class molecular chaperone
LPSEIDHRLQDVERIIDSIPENYSRKDKELEVRIKELERFQDITHEKYQKNIKGRTPHKCPVCDGVGVNVVIGEVRGLPIKSDKCPSCEGKGIVWG